MEPKQFYQTYHANNSICKLDTMLIDEVMKQNPENVFEFGCGTGKILRVLQNKNPHVNVTGLDLSFLNIIHARAQNNIPFLIIGDEYFLCRLKSFDVSFTVSVLCHIKNIDEIVSELKRMSRLAVFIAETTDVVGEFYYSHDYESYGFNYTGLSWYSPANGANYKIYKT